MKTGIIRKSDIMDPDGDEDSFDDGFILVRDKEGMTPLEHKVQSMGWGRLPVAVRPDTMHDEGLGSILQHYRRSLWYALELGLPWLGTLLNTHDGIDYAEYLGLCQPLCTNRSDLSGFAKVNISYTSVDFKTKTFQLPEGITKPSLIVVTETTSYFKRMSKHGGKWVRSSLDEGHASFLVRIRERFLKQQQNLRCPEKPLLSVHYRWGDVRGHDLDATTGRGVGLKDLAALSEDIQSDCSFDVKLLSQGHEIKKAFADRFQYAFDYQDGALSKDLYETLQTFACSSVLVAGGSSFAVLGALLSQGVVIAPKSSLKFHDLPFVVDAGRSLRNTHNVTSHLKAALCQLPQGKKACRHC
jgi:hypothetical protein